MGLHWASVGSFHGSYLEPFQPRSSSSQVDSSNRAIVTKLEGTSGKQKSAQKGSLQLAQTTDLNLCLLMFAIPFGIAPSVGRDNAGKHDANKPHQASTRVSHTEHMFSMFQEHTPWTRLA